MMNNEVMILINEYYKLCQTKYYKHIRTAEMYKTYYTNSTIPIIILSSATTLLASYNGSFLNENFAIIVAVLSGLTTITQALSSFLEYNTKYEIHFTVANKFNKLYHNIEKELFINYYNKETNEVNLQNIDKLLDNILKELTVIQESSPYIPSKIENKSFNIKDIVLYDKSNLIEIKLDSNVENLLNLNSR